MIDITSADGHIAECQSCASEAAGADKGNVTTQFFRRDQSSVGHSPISLRSQLVESFQLAIPPRGKNYEGGLQTQHSLIDLDIKFIENLLSKATLVTHRLDVVGVDWLAI